MDDIAGGNLGTYSSGVTTGGAGALAGDSTASAAFSGSGSYVDAPDPIGNLGPTGDTPSRPGSR